MVCLRNICINTLHKGDNDDDDDDDNNNNNNNLLVLVLRIILPYRGTGPITVYVLMYGWKNWQACRIIHELDYVLPTVLCRVDQEDRGIKLLRNVGNYYLVC